MSDIGDTIRQAAQKLFESEVQQFDDTGLTIPEPLYWHLVNFTRTNAPDEDSRTRYLHFTDWHGSFDLPALEAAGLVTRGAGKARAEGWREHFPEHPYHLTVKAVVILRHPGKYVVSAGSEERHDT